MSAIGKAAGVVVDERMKGGQARAEVRQCSRPAAGVRPSVGDRVMPTVLRELMRHEDIATTMKYYVGQNAEATADAFGLQ